MFEFIEKYKNCGLALPVRKTSDSAGYDLAAAEDIIIPPMEDLMVSMLHKMNNMHISSFTLDEMAALTKECKTKPTLVPTGLKCKLPEGTYLELSVRSSTPLKYWLVLANGVGRLF